MFVLWSTCLVVLDSERESLTLPWSLWNGLGTVPCIPCHHRCLQAHPAICSTTKKYSHSHPAGLFSESGVRKAFCMEQQAYSVAKCLCSSFAWSFKLGEGEALVSLQNDPTTPHACSMAICLPTPPPWWHGCSSYGWGEQDISVQPCKPIWGGSGLIQKGSDWLNPNIIT